MGKAARNERLKLRANFFNALASGVALAGIYVPTFALFFGNVKDGSMAFVVFAFAAIVSFCCYKAAQQVAGEIED